MAVIDNAFLDLLIVHNFLIHMLQERNLFANEVFGATCVKVTPSPLAVAHISVHVSQPVLQYLESILGELLVELSKVRNWAHRGENRVVFGSSVTRAERCNHGNSLSGTQCTQCLVLNVSTLEDYGRTLQRTLVSMRG